MQNSPSISLYHPLSLSLCCSLAGFNALKTAHNSMCRMISPTALIAFQCVVWFEFIPFDWVFGVFRFRCLYLGSCSRFHSFFSFYFFREGKKPKFNLLCCALYNLCAYILNFQRLLNAHKFHFIRYIELHARIPLNIFILIFCFVKILIVHKFMYMRGCWVNERTYAIMWMPNSNRLTHTHYIHDMR